MYKSNILIDKKKNVSGKACFLVSSLTPPSTPRMLEGESEIARQLGCGRSKACAFNLTKDCLCMLNGLVCDDYKKKKS